MSKYGYPDMGNNLYADLLPYKDWVKINNAQRCHEFGYEHAVVLIPNAFIASFRLPKFTVAMLAVYLGLRLVHVTGWHTYRGHNNAFVAEEFMKLCVVVLVFGAMTSSVMMLGYRLPLFIGKRLPHL